MRLEQALTEIIANALDAMPDGGRLEIAAQPQNGDAATDGVLLEITDSGRGIAAEILPNLCEPFFTTRPEAQASASPSRSATSRKPAAAWTSPVGRHGTTVGIWLPLASGEAAQTPARSLS